MTENIERRAGTLACLCILGLLAPGCVIDHKLGDPAGQGSTSAASSSTAGTTDASATGQTPGGTTMASGGSVPTLCEAACTGNCLTVSGESMQMCLDDCEQAFAQFSGSATCTTLYETAITCMTAANCNEGQCTQKIDQLETQCTCEVIDAGQGGGGSNGGSGTSGSPGETGGTGGSPGQTGGTSGGSGGFSSMCFWDWTCYGSSHGLSCAGDTCTCKDHGAVTGTCPAAGVCDQVSPGDLSPPDGFVQQCCGFDDFPPGGVSGSGGAAPLPGA